MQGPTRHKGLSGGSPGVLGSGARTPGRETPRLRGEGARQAQSPLSSGPGSLAGRIPPQGTPCCLQPRARRALLLLDASDSSFASPRLRVSGFLPPRPRITRGYFGSGIKLGMGWDGTGQPSWPRGPGRPYASGGSEVCAAPLRRSPGALWGEAGCTTAPVAAGTGFLCALGPV